LLTLRRTRGRFSKRRRIQRLSEVTVLDAVFHVIDHFSTHIGRLILRAELRAGRGLAFYDFTSGEPRAKWK
jgi:hypothetical protein